MSYFDRIKDEVKKEAKEKWDYELPDKSGDERSQPNTSSSMAAGGGMAQSQQQDTSQNTDDSSSGKGFDFLKQKAVEAREELERIKQETDDDDTNSQEPQGNPENTKTSDNTQTSISNVTENSQTKSTETDQTVQQPNERFDFQPRQERWQESQNTVPQQKNQEKDEDKKAEQEEFSFKPKTFQQPYKPSTTTKRSIFNELQGESQETKESPQSQTQQAADTLTEQPTDDKKDTTISLLQEIRDQNTEIVRLLKQMDR